MIIRPPLSISSKEVKWKFFTERHWRNISSFLFFIYSITISPLLNIELFESEIPDIFVYKDFKS